MRFFAFPVVYALSVIAGRATRIVGGEVSLVWPAAAVGVIWMLATSARGTRERAVHVTLLGLVAYATVWFAVVNIVLSVVTAGVLHADRTMYHAKRRGKNRVSVGKITAEPAKPSAQQ